jgi:hypothetical protein
MKMNIGVDRYTVLIYSVEINAANAHGLTQATNLLYG